MLATKRIGVGIVGAGLSARIFHAPFLYSEDEAKCAKNYQLLCFLRTSSTDPVTGFENVPVVKDVNEFIALEGLDLVVITTPYDTHYSMAKLFLEAGKHVVVEKPFCVTFEEACMLDSLAQRKNLLLTIYHNRRWDGDFLTVKRILAQREEESLLGRIVQIQSHFDRFRPELKAFVTSSDGSGTKVPVWRENPANVANGPLYDLGSHMIDQALLLAFQLHGSVNSVKVSGTSRNMRSLSTDDFFDIRLEFTNERKEPLIISLQASMLAQIPGPRFLVHGTKGSLLIQGLDAQEDQLRAGMKPNDPRFGSDAGKRAEIHVKDQLKQDLVLERGSYATFYEDLANVLLQHSNSYFQPAVTAQQAALVIKIIEAVKESSQLERTIQVSLK